MNRFDALKLDVLHRNTEEISKQTLFREGIHNLCNNIKIIVPQLTEIIETNDREQKRTVFKLDRAARKKVKTIRNGVNATPSTSPMR